MKINSVNNINFEAKVKTTHLLEITTQTMFEPDGFMGMTNTLKKIYPLPKATGHRGYRYYAKLAGDKLCDKYTQIADATRLLKMFLKVNPNSSREKLQSYARSLASRIGEEIDVVL